MTKTQTLAATACSCLIAALLSAPLRAELSASDINFDKGIDVHALMQQGNDPAQGGTSAGPVSATRSCAVASFEPGAPSTSTPMSLQSVVTQRVCHQYWGKNICGDQVLRTVSRNVVVTLRGRHALLPWQTEAFGVCLQDDQLSEETLKAVHQYREPVYHSDASGQWTVSLTAKRKIQSAPDSEGVTLAAVTELADGIQVDFADKWADNYKRDKTRLRVEIKRDIKFALDSKLFEMDFSTAAAPTYTVTFQDTEHRLRTGDKYYVVWKFQREGKVSTDAVEKGGRSEDLVLKQIHN